MSKRLKVEPEQCFLRPKRVGKDDCERLKANSTMELASQLVRFPGARVCPVLNDSDREGDLHVHKDGVTLAFITLTGF